MTAAAASTTELLRAYREQGDLEARDRLVEDHLALVRALARRYANRGEPLDDLVQVGTIGLLKAIDRFDPERGAELTSYAVPTIVGELKRHFRDTGWAVHVPRRLKELSLGLSQQMEALSSTLGRSPTIAELAEAVDADEESVLEALEASRAYTAVSLSAPVGDAADENPSPLDGLGQEEAGYEVSEHRAVLEPALAVLDERERRILQLRFEEGLTQTQIAEVVGVSQMHVSRLIRGALDKLHAELDEGAVT